MRSGAHLGQSGAEGTHVAKLGLRQLEQHLSEAVKILHGRMDAAERCRHVLGVLLLKRCSDRFDEMREQAAGEQKAEGGALESPHRDVFFVPERARWPFVVSGSRQKGAGEQLLDRAMEELREGNGALKDSLGPIGFAWWTGRTVISDREIQQLVDHFDRHRLRDDDLESPDLLGAAGEYLVGKLANEDGKRGGEFHTPRGVIRMMNRLVKPRPGMRVYDPCLGSGGMLVHAREYIDEHGQDACDLALYGQENDGGFWAVSKLNMILHGVLNADIRHGDTLAWPQHVENGELMRFDRVLTNPPFSLRYDLADLERQERFQYGHTSTSDLMFVQHVLAVLTPTGLGAMVAPHSVLFRGGKERTIRQRIVEDDRLEAVIGLPPNLFHGAGVHTCVLVLRGTARREEERRGKVLFVNADREYTRSRWRNHLGPQHAEKIVAAYEEYRDIPGFTRVVDIEELRKNDFDLYIRRYVDNTPPAEPQDVHAHLEGGMPRAEVMARMDLLASYGIGPQDLFTERKNDHGPYLDFLPKERRPGPDRFAELARPREDALWQAFAEGWTVLARRLVDLAGPSGRNPGRGSRECRIALMRIRGELKSIFAGMVAAGPLDRHAVAGGVAEWWAENKHGLLAVAEHGFATAAEQDTVLRTLHESLRGGLNDLIVRRRGELVETYRRWEGKYALSFREIELSLAGTAVSLSLYGQWSMQEPWDLADSGSHRAGDRHRVVGRLHAVIDAEKDLEAEIAKLDIDRQTVLLPLVSPVFGSSWECERVLLGAVVESIHYGIGGLLSSDVRGLPVLRAGNIGDDGMELEDLRYRTKPTVERDLLREGDVLLAATGKGVSIWHGELPEATFSETVIRLTTNDQWLLAEYLVEWLRHPVIQDRIGSLSTPGSFPHRLSIARLLDLDMELPELDAQRQVVSEIEEISRKLGRRRAQLAKLCLIKQTLTDDLRKGRMSVTYFDAAAAEPRTAGT